MAKKLIFDFDTDVNRTDTNSYKYDVIKQKFNSNDILPMWVADMDFYSPNFLKSIFCNRVEHTLFGYIQNSNNYFDSAIKWQQTNHNMQTKRSDYIQINSVVAGICIAINTVSCEGDEIIIQTPVYHHFHKSISLNNRVAIENPLIYKNNKYSIDFENLQNIITKKTKAILLCNPHNPTGMVLSIDDLKKIAQLALENNLYIISDEIHCDLVYSKYKHIPIINISEKIKNKTITLISPSKTFNLAGLATGISIIPNKNLRDKFIHQGLKSHSFINNIFGSIACEEVYKNGHTYKNNLIKYIENNFKFIYEELKNTKLKIIKPQGTYLLWIDFKNYNLSSKEINDVLIDRCKLALSSGDGFGKLGDGFMRMNIATNHKNIKIAIASIKDYFK
jgi:cystathionine beta-lyase